MSHSVAVGSLIDRLQPGINVVVTQVGIDAAEVGALLDMKTEQPLPDRSKHRRFTRALTARNVALITYRELVGRQGLEAMRRPAG